MSLKKIKSIIDELSESSIDFPHEKQSEDVWDNGMLREDVKELILEAIKSYPEYDLIDLARDIYIIGSITSNTYGEDSDLDIHIIPKIEQVPNEDNIEFTKKVMKWYKANRDSKNWYAGTHPFEVFVEFDEESDLRSVGVYSVMQDKWIKKPSFEKNNYNPYKVFNSVFQQVKKTLEKSDLDILDLRRNLVDYKYIRNIIKKVPLDVKEELVTVLKQKLEDMKEDIEDLAKEKSSWKEKRREYPAGTKEWEDINAEYKMVQRFMYGKLISDLEDLISNNELDDSEIPELENSLQKFMEF